MHVWASGERGVILVSWCSMVPTPVPYIVTLDLLGSHYAQQPFSPLPYMAAASPHRLHETYSNTRGGARARVWPLNGGAPRGWTACAFARGTVTANIKSLMQHCLAAACHCASGLFTVSLILLLSLSGWVRLSISRNEKRRFKVAW